MRLALIGGALLAPGAPLGLFLTAKLFPNEDLLVAGLLYSGVATAIVFSAFGYWAGSLMDDLNDAAVRDGLTGLFNRRFMRESFPGLQADAERGRRSLAFLMLDLDRFKRVNDTYGHIVGDQTIRAVADVLSERSRAGDLVARFGGEEFAILCPDTTQEDARELAERLREAVGSLGEAELGHPGPQTVSVGVSVQKIDQPTPSPEALIERADQALYRAKDNGRDRVELG